MNVWRHSQTDIQSTGEQEQAGDSGAIDIMNNPIIGKIFTVLEVLESSDVDSQRVCS